MQSPIRLDIQEHFRRCHWDEVPGLAPKARWEESEQTAIDLLMVVGRPGESPWLSEPCLVSLRVHSDFMCGSG